MSGQILTKGSNVWTYNGDILKTKDLDVGNYYIGDINSLKTITGSVSINGNSVAGSSLPYTTQWNYCTVGSDSNIDNLLIVNKGGALTKLGNMVFGNGPRTIKYILDCRNVSDSASDARLLYDDDYVTSIDASGIYNIPNGYKIYMFANWCDVLRDLDISGWDMTNFDWMNALRQCPNLARIYVDNCPEITITKTITHLANATWGSTPRNWTLSTYKNRRVLVPST